MRTNPTILFCALALAAFATACATATPDDMAECRDADWFKIGRRDGQAGRNSQLETRSSACAPLGVKPDAEQYEKGLREGRANHATTAAPRRISLF